jgi:NAD-dependent DNA ligase
MKKEVVIMNTQIVLFFEKIVEYNTIKLANSINEKIPEIGQPNIFSIPDNIPNEIRIQTPRIVFNNIGNINITITSSRIDIVSNNINDINRYLKRLYEALNENGLEIQSVGLVNTFISNDIKMEKIQKYFFNEEIQKSDLINVSWYKKLDNINIWKHIETQDNNAVKDLIYTIDINNLGNKQIMSIEEIISMLEKSSNITKDAVNKISEELGE